MGPDAAGYTSSYTSWGDPTHPLDPRKIFSRSFWPSILSTEQTVRYSFDVRGFNLGDYGVLVSRSRSPPLPPASCPSISLFLSLSSSLSFSQSLCSFREPLSSILIRWFIISTRREGYHPRTRRERGWLVLSRRVP